MEDRRRFRKAAIFMVSLDPPVAGEVLRRMKPHVVERLTLAIAELDRIDPQERLEVFREFQSLNGDHQPDAGGVDYARTLVERSLPADLATTIVQELEGRLSSRPFAWLLDVPIRAVSSLLAGEHPQTTALILGSLPPSFASQLLQSLPTRYQVDVTCRLAALEPVSRNVLTDIEAGLRHRLGGVAPPHEQPLAGPRAVAHLLNHVGRTTERTIMQHLEKESPQLAEDVRRLMFVFDDLLRFDARSVQEILKEITADTLALALKTAGEPIRDRFLAAMSQRAGLMLRENMELLGTPRPGEVERAQGEIVAAVRRLADAGVIILKPRERADAFME